MVTDHTKENVETQQGSTSVAKVQANRDNAQKSTGPKDTSHTRLNAMKHGLLSKEVLLKGEDSSLLEELASRLRASLLPENELEDILWDRIVASLWRLKRAVRLERQFLQAEYEDSTYDALERTTRQEGKAWCLVVHRNLGNSSSWVNLMRYENALEKQVFKSLHELQRIQAMRNGEKVPVPIAIDLDVSNPG